MKYVYVVLLSVLMAGCAAPIVVVDVPNLETSSKYTVEDLRPQTEKEFEIFSLSITNEAYGFYRQGDQTNPDPLRILQHRIHQKFADSGKVPEIKVHHFVTYTNRQSELRYGVMAGTLGGVVGSLAMTAIQEYDIAGIATNISPEEFNLADDEYKNAMYSEAENPEKISVLQVYLDAEINGERHFIRTMTPVFLENHPNKIPVVVAIETAITYYLDQYPAKT